MRLEELGPAGIDRIWIGRVLLVHLLEQPVVGPEVRTVVVVRRAGGWGMFGRDGHYRLLPFRAEPAWVRRRLSVSTDARRRAGCASLSTVPKYRDALRTSSSCRVG